MRGIRAIGLIGLSLGLSGCAGTHNHQHHHHYASRPGATSGGPSGLLAGPPCACPEPSRPLSSSPSPMLAAARPPSPSPAAAGRPAALVATAATRPGPSP